VCVVVPGGEVKLVLLKDVGNVLQTGVVLIG